MMVEINPVTNRLRLYSGGGSQYVVGFAAEPFKSGDLVGRRL